MKKQLKVTTRIIVSLFALQFTLQSAWASDTISVMIEVTSGAMLKMGGGPNCTKVIMEDINNINQSFVNCRIDGFVKVNYLNQYEGDNENCMKKMLDDVISDKKLTIHDRRITYAADIVMIIVDDPTACGISGQYPYALQAYMILHYECLGANYSMARELGYLLGCGNHESQSGRYNSYNPKALAYFSDEDQEQAHPFSTIMGYTDERISCTDSDFNMIPYWSCADPSIVYNGQPVGDPEHDNAGQIRIALNNVPHYREELGMVTVDGDVISASCLVDLRAPKVVRVRGMEFKPGSKGVIRSEKIVIDSLKAGQGAKVQLGKRSRED